MKWNKELHKIKRYFQKSVDWNGLEIIIIAIEAYQLE